MRRLVYILVVMVVAGAVGCRRSASEMEQRLIDIDSLIADSPDSALTLLGEISATSDELQATSSEPSEPSENSESSENSENSENSEKNSPSKIEGVPAWRGRMTGGEGTLRGRMTPGERAYHALLTAQAMYKAYIPATSDSVINVAWDYYKDLGLLASAADRQRRVRAMLYKGTTAEELGHPDSAMYWYKRTELEAAPDDHYHRGYALMNMGQLYQTNYESKPAIDKYLKSLTHINKIADTACLLFVNCQMSSLYQIEESDSSELYIENLDLLSKKCNDSLYMLAAANSRTAKYYYDFDYKNAKNCAVNAINRFFSYSVADLWYFASYSYAKLGLEDSALYYLNNAPLPVSIKDSILYFESLKSISEMRGDWQSVYKYDSIGGELSENTIDIAIANKLSKYESDAEKQFTEESNSNSVQKSIIILSVLFIVIIIGIYVVNRIKWHHELENFKKFTISIEQQKSLLSNRNEELSGEIRNLQNSIESLSAVFRAIFTAIQKNPGRQLDTTIKALMTEKFFRNIYQYVEYTHNDLLNEIRSSGILNKREIDIVCLYLCHLPDSVIQVYAGLTNIRSVNKIKKTIAVKLKASSDASIKNLRKF